MRLLFLAMLALGLSIAPARFRPPSAQTLFSLALTQNGVTNTGSFGNPFDLITLANVLTLVPAGASHATVTGTVNMRGLVGNVSMVSVPGIATLTVTYPGIYTGSFIGATRATAFAQMSAFFRGVSPVPAHRAALVQLQQAAVRSTRYDPVANNPSSLLGQMATADFTAGTTPLNSLPGLAPRSPGWRFGTGASGFATIGAGHYNTQAQTVPLNAAYTFEQFGGIEVFANAPLSRYNIAGSESYQAAVGAGVRVPLLRGPDLSWAITPALRYGVAGSNQIGTGGSILGGSLSSDLRLALPQGFALQLGTMLGYYETQPLQFGTSRLNYQLANQALRNGATLSRPIGTLLGVPLHAAASAADTRITGSRTFDASWQEYAVSLAAEIPTPVSLSLAFINSGHQFKALRAGITFGF